jgi:hypothetical protein
MSVVQTQFAGRVTLLRDKGITRDFLNHRGRVLDILMAP